MSEFTCELENICIYGYLTKTVLSGSVYKLTKELTYCYLNFRPIDLPRKFKNLIQDLYKQFNPSSNICVILNMIVPDGCYDINVSPDKREVFLKDEAAVLS